MADADKKKKAPALELHIETGADVNPGSEPVKPAPSKYRRKQAEEKSAQTAYMLLVILNGLVVAQFGDECSMTDTDRELIEKPLARIMARLDEETSEAVDKWIDPVMLMFGVMAWGSRVYRIESDRREASTKISHRAGADVAAEKIQTGDVEYDDGSDAPVIMPSDVISTRLPQALQDMAA